MQHKYVKVLSRGGVTVLAIAGDTLADINEYTCRSGDTPQVKELIEEFRQAAGMAPGSVVVDVREADVLDHASVSVLFRLAKILMDHSKPRLICCSPSVKELFDIFRLETICASVTELEVAVAELGQEAPNLQVSGCPSSSPPRKHWWQSW